MREKEEKEREEKEHPVLLETTKYFEKETEEKERPRTQPQPPRTTKKWNKEKLEQPTAARTTTSCKSTKSSGQRRLKQQKKNNQKLKEKDNEKKKENEKEKDNERLRTTNDEGQQQAEAPRKGIISPCNYMSERIHIFFVYTF